MNNVQFKQKKDLEMKINNKNQVSKILNSQTSNKKFGNNKSDSNKNNTEERILNPKTRLMTRKQLMNPFDSDSEEEIELINKCMFFIIDFTLIIINSFFSQLFRGQHFFNFQHRL